jgi:hypothetical protein
MTLLLQQLIVRELPFCNRASHGWRSGFEADPLVTFLSAQVGPRVNKNRGQANSHLAASHLTQRNRGVAASGAVGHPAFAGVDLFDRLRQVTIE